MIGCRRKLGSEAKSLNLSAMGKIYTKTILTHTQNRLAENFDYEWTRYIL